MVDLNDIITWNANRIIKEKSVDPETVAKAVGLRPEELYAVLNGRRKMRGTEAYGISRALSVPFKDLFDVSVFFSKDDRMGA